MAVAAGRLDRDVRPRAAVPGVRPVIDHTFEILGGTAADGVDIASIFAAASVRMGDSVWVRYVPVDGRPACRVRLSKSPVYSGGDGVEATFVLDAEMFRRRDVSASGRRVFIDGGVPAPSDMIVPERPESTVRRGRRDGRAPRELRDRAVDVVLLPLSRLAAHIPSYAGGQRLVALGMLAWMYGRDPDTVRRLLENELAVRGGRTVSAALRLFELGWREAPRWVDCRFDTTAAPSSCAAARPNPPVLDGRRAIALAALRSGIGHCLVAEDHPLAEGVGRLFADLGGRLIAPDGADAGPAAERRRSHEPEAPPARPGEGRPPVPGSGRRSSGDDASPVGPCLVIDLVGGADPGDMEAAGRRGPERDGMRRAPRVIVRLARVPPGEQLRLPAWFDPLGIGVTCPRAVPAGAGAAAGISQPAVLAPASVDECYRFTAMAARIADRFRRDVIVLVDASLLDTVQGSASGPHPETPIDQALFGPEALLHAGQLAPPSARAAVKALLAGLRLSEAALDRFVEPGAVVGGDRGDVLLVGWGATRGPVEEAVARLRARGASVSALHVRTLRPAPARLADALARFRRIVVIDVAEHERAAEGRLRHLTAWLRAAAGQGIREPSSAPPWQNLCWHAFSGERPLSPGAVADLVLSLDLGPDAGLAT